jgi:Mce-associated membrane protein
MLHREIRKSQNSGHRPDKAGTDLPPADAESADTESADNQSADDQSADDQSADDQSADDQSADDQSADACADSAAATSPAADAPALGGKANGWRSMRWPAILGVATALLGGFGVWATLTAHSLGGTGTEQNAALTDQAGTSAVTHQIGSAVNTIFSYSYADTARTRRAAQSLLTGAAIRQYDKLFALVQQEAPKEKLVVTTTVTNIGVEYLVGASARVLVFANQQDTLAGTSQTTYAGTMFAVTAVRQDGRWKIENIDTFTGATG